MFTINRFQYADDFEISLDTWNRYNWDKYPADIKRIWSSCSGGHTFRKRLYFYSPSYRKVYKIGSDPLQYRERGNDPDEDNGTHVYCLIDDMNKLYSFNVNEFLITFTRDMNKIELPKKYR